MGASGPFALGPAGLGSKVRAARPTSSEAKPILPHHREPSIKQEPTDNDTKMNLDDQLIQDLKFEQDAFAPVFLPTDQDTKDDGQTDIKDESHLGEEGADIDVHQENHQAEQLNPSKSLSDFFVLTKQDLQDHLLFFQFPPTLPQFWVPSELYPESIEPAIPASNPPETSQSSEATPSTEKETFLPLTDDRVEGCIGKLVIYKSSKVQLKIGNLIFDVSAGANCHFLECITAIDAENKQAFSLGNIEQHLVCTPDLDQLLNDLEL